MKIVVLTLPDRPERLDAYLRRNGCLGTVHYGMRGQTAWDGCLAGHHAIWQQATEDTLVLEDDVLLVDDWQQRIPTPPADWDLLYLGGQHVRRPMPVAPGLVRCVATFRTHAYLLRHTSVPRLLQHTSGADHLDAQLVQAQRRRQFKAYAVTPWLAGQAAGLSAISGRVEPERWWQQRR